MAQGNTVAAGGQWRPRLQERVHLSGGPYYVVQALPNPVPLYIQMEQIRNENATQVAELKRKVANLTTEVAQHQLLIKFLTADVQEKEAVISKQAAKELQTQSLLAEKDKKLHDMETMCQEKLKQKDGELNLFFERSETKEFELEALRGQFERFQKSFDISMQAQVELKTKYDDLVKKHKSLEQQSAQFTKNKTAWEVEKQGLRKAIESLELAQLSNATSDRKKVEEANAKADEAIKREKAAKTILKKVNEDLQHVTTSKLVIEMRYNAATQCTQRLYFAVLNAVQFIRKKLKHDTDAIERVKILEENMVEINHILMTQANMEELVARGTMLLLALQSNDSTEAAGGIRGAESHGGWESSGNAGSLRGSTVSTDELHEDDVPLLTLGDQNPGP